MFKRIKKFIGNIQQVGKLCRVTALRRVKKAFLFDIDDLTDVDGLEYWRGKIFNVILDIVLIIASPMFFWGSYLFVKEGLILAAIAQIVFLFGVISMVKLDRISEALRKILGISSLYLCGILAVVFAGTMGCGMVLVFFCFIFAGFLLDFKQACRLIGINILIFIGLTVLLELGFFEGMPISTYGEFWLINAVPTQFMGVLSFALMTLIFQGLQKQTVLIKNATEMLTESEGRHKSMLSNITDIIAIINEDGMVKYISPNTHKYFGWTMEDFYSESIWFKICLEDREFVKSELMQVFQEARIEKIIETRHLCKNGEVKNIEMTAVNLNEHSKIQGILMTYHDITEYKMREKKIEYLTYRDKLTGLYNRGFLEKEKVRINTEDNLPISMIVGDVNGLKLINDALGHIAGDKLLVTIADILISCCDDSVTIARVGGDEFCILMPRTDAVAAGEQIQRIHAACKMHNENSMYETFYLSISLGTATKSHSSESMDDLLKQSDEHMYKRKNQDSGNIQSAILASMRQVMSVKCGETEEHCTRLAKLSRKLGEACDLTMQQLDDLELLSMMHDIGKIGLDVHILYKNGPLTDHEANELRKHSEIGYRIAKACNQLHPIAENILTHHEQWDGNGYPQGFSGENIPLLSRIFSVVHTYVALMDGQTDGKAITEEAALEAISKKSGLRFDPAIVDAFIDMIKAC